MAGVLGKLPPADPWHAPAVATATRVRPDSVVSHGKLQRLAVTLPEDYLADARYPLVVDMRGEHRDAAAIVVAPIGQRRATAAEIAAYVRLRYPVDPARTTLH
jgi:hypothetical protein